jgi:hypothetical protein
MSSFSNILLNILHIEGNVEQLISNNQCVTKFLHGCSAAPPKFMLNCSSNWRIGDLFLGHNYAIGHSALSVNDFLQKKLYDCSSATVLQSPDPGQYGSILFSNLTASSMH